MFGFLVVIHILVSIIMIVFILLQDPKGGGALGGMLGGGGGSKSLFGSTGANQFLINVTKWTAIIFAITSISLATLSAQTDKSIMDKYVPTTTNSKTEQTESATNTKENNTQKNRHYRKYH